MATVVSRPKEDDLEGGDQDGCCSYFAMKENSECDFVPVQLMKMFLETLCGGDEMS